MPKKVGGGHYSSEEEKKAARNIHYIRYKQNQEKKDFGNVVFQRDGQSLGDLNFRGPIQNISLNENRELEISFGVSKQLYGGDQKIYNSQNAPKTEVVKVPLGGFDSDESIEVNIDIDWPKREGEQSNGPKEVKEEYIFNIQGLPEPEETDRLEHSQKLLLRPH